MTDMVHIPKSNGSSGARMWSQNVPQLAVTLAAIASIVFCYYIRLAPHRREAGVVKIAALGLYLDMRWKKPRKSKYTSRVILTHSLARPLTIPFPCKCWKSGVNVKENTA
jgi:hypothetical protein